MFMVTYMAMIMRATTACVNSRQYLMIVVCLEVDMQPLHDEAMELSHPLQPNIRASNQVGGRVLPVILPGCDILHAHSSRNTTCLACPGWLELATAEMPLSLLVVQGAEKSAWRPSQPQLQ
jgi:hypothetical protein